MKQTISLLALMAAIPAFAQDTRQLDAHEHGVGTLNIAIDGTSVVMEFHAPGADIVGFEYAAESDADLAAIDAAIKTLAMPLDLFVPPSAAGCSVTDASAELEIEDSHDGSHDHDHGEKHGEEGHEDHAEDGHDDHGHDDHADEAGHSEFHAEYTLACDTPEALTSITFAYFDSFPNAQEVEVQLVSASGAQAFEVERSAPVLDLGR